MAGFADLKRRAQPALASVNASGTEGRTWLWDFDIYDDEDDPVDLSTGAVGTCTIVDTIGGTLVATLTFTGANGSFSVGLDESATVDLAGGDNPRLCRWSLIVVKAGDSVQFWGPIDSHFKIQPE